MKDNFSKVKTDGNKHCLGFAHLFNGRFNRNSEICILILFMSHSMKTLGNDHCAHENPVAEENMYHVRIKKVV